MRNIFLASATIFLLSSLFECEAQTKFVKYKKYLIPIDSSAFRKCSASDPGGAKPRVIVTTDLNRASASNHLLSLGDPDDIQSMIHLLASSNKFVTKGLISTPATYDIRVGQEKEHIENIIKGYKHDFNASNPAFLQSLGYPNPAELLSVVRQGVLGGYNARDLPYNPGDSEHQGAKLILAEATKILDRTSCGPLNILVWGPIPDLTLALKESERLGLGIEKALRVYFIASTNRIGGQRQRSFDYIKETFLDNGRLWFIQSEDTFKGMGNVSTSNQLAFLNRVSNTSSANNQSCLSYVLRRSADAIHVNPNQTQFWVKAGDTPSLLHVMDPNWNLSDSFPSSPNWGGQYQLKPGKSLWWIDGPGPASVTTNIQTSGGVYDDWELSMARFTAFRNSSCAAAVNDTVTN